MNKVRHRDLKDLLDVDFSGFEWIAKIKPYGKFVPCTNFSYLFTFWRPITSIINHEEKRELFEQVIRDFYEVSKGRHQVICLWEERNVIVIVF